MSSTAAQLRQLDGVDFDISVKKDKDINVMEDIAKGPELPFAHPYHWAAFFTQGVERLEVRWG